MFITGNSHLIDFFQQREVLPQDSDDDKEERAEEKPVVVILNSGDLTAEEAEAFNKQKEEGIDKFYFNQNIYDSGNDK